jgi:hypothetical protein
MATVMDRGAMTTVGRGRPRAARPSPPPITLSDLITAIQDVVGPGDDELVVATVRHLLRSGRFTALRSGTRRCSPQRPEEVSLHMVTGGSDTRARWPAGGPAAGVWREEESGELPGTQSFDYRRGGEVTWESSC